MVEYVKQVCDHLCLSSKEYVNQDEAKMEAQLGQLSITGGYLS